MEAKVNDSEARDEKKKSRTTPLITVVEREMGGKKRRKGKGN